MPVSGAENQLIPVRGETPSCTVIIPGLVRHISARGGCSCKKPNSGKVVALSLGLPLFCRTGISAEVRLPDKFKHIIQRRKRN